MAVQLWGPLNYTTQDENGKTAADVTHAWLLSSSVICSSFLFRPTGLPLPCSFHSV